MLRDLSFKEVCEFIKEDDPSLIEAADKLLGLGLILSPIALGLPPEVTASVLGLLEVKNELIKLGKDVFEKVARQRDENALAKQQRMRIAYGLICYTAFFEAVDQVMPEIKKPLGLKPEEKFLLSEGAVSRVKSKSNANCALEEAGDLLENWKIVFPHPVDKFERQNAYLADLYEELSKGFISFLKGLTIWESAGNETREKISTVVKDLPEAALSHFEAQYYQLAVKFPEFSIWSNLLEHKKTRDHTELLANSMTEFYKQYASLVKVTNKSVDQGFAKLSKVIETIPAQLDQLRANKALEDLKNYYNFLIDQPIIKDPYEAGEGAATLTFPKKSKTFIPQSFKAIHCTTGKERLENEATWRKVESRNDLGAFLISFISSPYSKSSPLIILGHPGSGKSLLTQILSAQLWSATHVPIRVELRDINAENDIPAQIHDQIYKDVDRNISWTDLIDCLNESVPVVILDGYDELLQASGKVFSGYLRKVQEFQEQQEGLGHPLVAIVTSRITLIDKADIPVGATVVRLEEFDEARRNKWISFWNRSNQKYFKQVQIEPFELPSDEKIIPLAEQPLLLLMLALYDSDGNQLRKSEGLDQTLLYDNLIRRFVKREKLKDKNFRDLEEDVREKRIDEDMKQLGVAAISMFNQRSLYIRTEQLDKALNFFRLEREIQDADGRSLSQAELLLGSFFFIHQSKSAQKSEHPQERKTEAAFEFLHNTFGEFLTADFILRQVLNETSVLHDMKRSPRLQPKLSQNLESPDFFSDAWFTSLIYTPLYSRPVIVSMLREWLQHKLIANESNYKDFLEDFDIIIANQINRLLTSNSFPSLMVGAKESCFNNLPLVGYIAIYSLNLILLRTILSPEEFIFDEKSISPHEDGTRIWDQLTFIWRSWFSLESLNGLTAILSAKREGSTIFLKARDSFSHSAFSDRLDSIVAVSLTLADDSIAGIAGLIKHSSLNKRNILSLTEIQARLESENIDLELKILIERLKCELSQSVGSRRRQELLETVVHSLNRSNWSEPEDIIDLIRLVRENANFFIQNRFLEILLHEMPPFDYFLPEYPGIWFETIKLIKLHKNLRFSDYFFERMFYRIPASFFENLSIEVVLEAISLVQEIGERRFLKYLFENLLKQLDLKSLTELSPEISIKILQLAKEIGDKKALAHVSQNLPERLLHSNIREVHPEAVLGAIRLAREADDQRIFEQLSEKFFELIHHRYFIDLSPQVVVDAIRLAQDIENPRLLKKATVAFLEWLHPRHFFMMLSVEGMTELTLLVRKVGDSKLLKRVGTVLQELVHPRYLTNIPLAMSIEMIKLAQELHDETTLNRVVEISLEELDLKIPEKVDFEAVTRLVNFLRETLGKEFARQFCVKFSRLLDYPNCPLNLKVEILILADLSNDRKFLKKVFNTSAIKTSRDTSSQQVPQVELRLQILQNINELTLDSIKAVYRIGNEFNDKELTDMIRQQCNFDQWES